MERISEKATGLVAALAVVVLYCAAAFGDDYPGVSVQIVKKASTTSNGSRIEYPKAENAEVTAARVEIPAGGQTGWHMHPAPVYAYVLSGNLTIESEGSPTQEFAQGDAIFENLGVSHNGRNSGPGTVKLIVFYTGDKGKPTTVRTPRNAAGAAAGN